MTTFDELIEVAARQLDERGLLLNRQLEQWASGDAALLQQVRERLLSAGVAQDRFGIGLARVGMAGVCLDALQSGRLNLPAIADNRPSADADDVISDSDVPDPEADWWLMSNGNVMGPWTIRRLIAMRTRNQLAASDLLRRGPRGLWLKLEEVSEFMHVEPQSAPMTMTHSVSSDAAAENSKPAAEIVAEKVNPPPRPNWFANPPERTKPGWEIAMMLSEAGVTAEGKQAPARPDSGASKPSSSVEPPSMQQGIRSLAKRNSVSLRDNDGNAWTFDSLTTALASALPAGVRHLFGKSGKSLRRQIMAVVLVAGAVIGVWWNLPLSNQAIFNEFEVVHRKVAELKFSRKQEALLAKELEADRIRIQKLVNILERRATDKPSIDRELLRAGRDSLLVSLQNPRRFDSVETNYSIHITQAALMMEGHSIDESTSREKPAAAPGAAQRSAGEEPASKDSSPK